MGVRAGGSLAVLIDECTLVDCGPVLLVQEAWVGPQLSGCGDVGLSLDWWDLVHIVTCNRTLIDLRDISLDRLFILNSLGLKSGCMLEHLRSMAHVDVMEGGYS